MKTPLYWAGHRTGKYEFWTVRPLRVFQAAIASDG